VNKVLALTNFQEVYYAKFRAARTVTSNWDQSVASLVLSHSTSAVNWVSQTLSEHDQAIESAGQLFLTARSVEDVRFGQIYSHAMSVGPLGTKI